MKSLETQAVKVSKRRKYSKRKGLSICKLKSKKFLILEKMKTMQMMSGEAVKMVRIPEDNYYCSINLYILH